MQRAIHYEYNNEMKCKLKKHIYVKNMLIKLTSYGGSENLFISIIIIVWKNI